MVVIIVVLVVTAAEVEAEAEAATTITLVSQKESVLPVGCYARLATYREKAPLAENIHHTV